MPRITLIGAKTSAEFRPLIRYLESVDHELSAHTYRDIGHWQESAEPQEPASLTVVLQSWSAEYPPAGVDRLVGATMFSGLICCYGAWCEGDGRTGTPWPPGTRVPLRISRALIDDTLRRLSVGETLLPPTAAPDEVFLYRRFPDNSPTRPSSRSILFVSPDHELRSTVGKLIERSGLLHETASLDPETLRIIRSPHVVLHDLDPEGDQISASLQRCRQRFPAADCFGLANLPQQHQSHYKELADVLPKLELMQAIDRLQAISAT